VSKSALTLRLPDSAGGINMTGKPIYAFRLFVNSSKQNAARSKRPLPNRIEVEYRHFVENHETMTAR
jgi:hypothetical protein